MKLRILNNIKNTDAIFDIPDNPDLNQMESRIYDKLGDFAKIYYYMFPHIWYESFQTKAIINQSFFISYEFGDREEENWDESQINQKKGKKIRSKNPNFSSNNNADENYIEERSNYFPK